LISGILKTHRSNNSNKGLVINKLAKYPTKVINPNMIRIPKPGMGIGIIPSRKLMVRIIT
jgi:hypothetical protein